MRRTTHFFVFVTALSIASALPAQFVEPAQKTRFDALNHALESSSPEQRVAFNALLVAFTTFRDARVQYEVCLAARPAGACPSQRATEKSHLNDSFLNRAWPQNAYGTALKETLEAPDAALNTAYEQLLSALPEACPVPMPACLPQSTFREIQRDWIRYRDAFVTFSALRSPPVPAEHWLVLLTTERTTQIAAIPKP